jgi:exonuclease III
MRKRTFYINKKRNIWKGNNDCQPICTQHQCTQFHQTYSKELKSTYRLQHSGSGRLLYPHHQYIGYPNKEIKKILELNHTIDQMDLADVYRIFHSTSAQYTFFTAAHGTFSKIDHIIGHKTSLSKYKKMEITPCILSDHNALKLEQTTKTSAENMQTIGS